MDRTGELRMETEWRALAEHVVCARPTTDDDARGVLEWLAHREGKSLRQLVEELRLHIGAAELA
jgi:hypothetical protein